MWFGFFLFCPSLQTLSQGLAVLKTAFYCKGTERCAVDRGDIATEHDGIIQPSPWDYCKVGIILDVKCMEVGLLCHLLSIGSLGAASMRSCFPLDLMGRGDREAGKVWYVRRADIWELVKLGKGEEY